MSLNTNMRQLHELRYCVSRIQQAMNGGKGFITVDTLRDYLQHSSSDGVMDFNGKLKMLKAHLIEESVDCVKYSMAIINQIKENGYKLAVPIKEMNLSPRLYNCLSRNGITFLADILLCSELYIARFRNMGERSLNELKSKLNDMGMDLFTDTELEKLSYIDFNFYGETRSVEELILLGLNKKLIGKIINNNLLNDISRRKKTSNTDLRVLSSKNDILAGVPERTKKYVVMGIGEEIKNDIASQRMPIKNSDRIINKIIDTKIKVKADYQMDVLDKTMEKDLILSEIMKDKFAVYLLEENFVVEYQNEIWGIITFSNIDTKARTELLKYVDDICTQHQNSVAK